MGRSFCLDEVYVPLIFLQFAFLNCTNSMPKTRVNLPGWLRQNIHKTWSGSENWGCPTFGKHIILLIVSLRLVTNGCLNLFLSWWWSTPWCRCDLPMLKTRGKLLISRLLIGLTHFCPSGTASPKVFQDGTLNGFGPGFPSLTSAQKILLW